MQIAVDGPRGSASAQEFVERIPKENLPPLTEAQRETARQLGASEEAYARMILEGERAQGELLVKTELFARLLEKKLREIESKAKIEMLCLELLMGNSKLRVEVSGRVIPLRIREDLVDEVFEAGSAEAEGRLSRILRTTLGLLEHQ